MKSVHLLFFILFMPISLLGQSGINDLINKLKVAGNDSEKISAYEKLIMHYAVKNPDSSEYYGNLGIAYAREKNYLKGEARINTQLGRIDESQGRVVLAKKHMAHALQIFKALNYPMGIAEVNGDLGTIEANKGNYDTAIVYFITAIKGHKEINDYKGLMVTASNLGSLYLQHEDTINAAKYLLLAEETSKKTPVIDQTISLYNTIAIMYDISGNKEKALEYFLNNLKLSDKPGFVTSHIECLLYLGEYFHNGGDKEKALFYLEEGLKKARENNIPEMQANILVNIAQIIKSNKPELAMEYLNKADTICRNTQNRSFLLSIYKERIELLANQGKYKEALEVAIQKQILNDSLYSIGKARDLACITSAFQLETNEQIKKLGTLSRHNITQRNELIIRYRRLDRNNVALPYGEANYLCRCEFNYVPPTV